MHLSLELTSPEDMNLLYALLNWKAIKSKVDCYHAFKLQNATVTAIQQGAI